METTTQDPGVEARQNEEALAAARDEAVKAERLRASKIRAIATGPFQVEESFLSALIDEGVSVDTARERIMNKVDAEYRKYPTIGINPPATFGGRDEVDKRREGMEAALFLRGNPRASAEMIEKGREFAGLTLVDMARAFGWRTESCESGEAMLAWIEQRLSAGQPLPDAMLVDWQLPGMNGLQSLAALAERVTRWPVRA